MYTTWRTKKLFNDLIRERSSEFRNLEIIVNPNTLIYKCKNLKRSLKDFRSYQNIIDLFENLRYGNVDPKEALKSQINLDQI